jgi:hypothetical protein
LSRFTTAAENHGTYRVLNCKAKENSEKQMVFNAPQMKIRENSQIF